MQQETESIPQVRELTPHERELIRWMLNHGRSTRAADYLSQLDRALVVSRCPCGCASIDLAVDGVAPAPGAGLEILADFAWSGPAGEVMGAFVFAKNDRLAGLEVYSADGRRTPDWLPRPSELQPVRYNSPPERTAPAE
jgi:hypothetical protein